MTPDETAGPPGAQSEAGLAEAPATPVEPVADARRLAEDLARRGVPPDEIQRLLALERGAGQPSAAAASAKAPVPVEVPAPAPFVPKPTIILPPVRDASAADQVAADRLLSQATASRRRGDFAEAERRCRMAVDLAPGDPVALELYGDVLQGIGRVDDALAVYERATEVDPSRPSAERKHAALVLMQDHSTAALAADEMTRNPHVAVLLSALLPGAGQVYNGQPVKAALYFGATVLVGIMAARSVLGLGASRSLSISVVVLVLMCGALYVLSVIDAMRSARPRQPRSGWDV